MEQARDFAIGFIRDHEGGLSMRPDDAGNWTGGARGIGMLVGSKFGVTAAALARYRGQRPSSITASAMAALTIEEAADIAVSIYFVGGGFDVLPWDRVAASIFDMSWGTGPRQCAKLVQRMIGAEPDGHFGTNSVAAYTGWRSPRTEEDASRQWGAVRNAFYDQIAANEGPNDPDRVFLKGWKNRTASFLPGTPWWAAFA
jgi:lysozyme family protein